MAFQFKIEHIALQPKLPMRARQLLKKLGLTDWVNDEMSVYGRVWSNEHEQGKVDLDFNYQADCDRTNDKGDRRPLELEIMTCTEGANWMGDDEGNFISHFGMQVTHEQLEEVEAIMSVEGIQIAQSVITLAHKNPHIKDSRRYKKVIFDTRSILGVDLEFNVLLSI